MEETQDEWRDIHRPGTQERDAREGRAGREEVRRALDPVGAFGVWEGGAYTSVLTDLGVVREVGE